MYVSENYSLREAAGAGSGSGPVRPRGMREERTEMNRQSGSAWPGSAKGHTSCLSYYSPPPNSTVAPR
jgi:hypothetical protein